MNTNPAITLENIRKSLDGREILKGIGFTVEKGDIFGYLGPNGAGKTTSIRILLGLFRADSGKAEILGSDAGLEETRRHIGFLLEGDGLYDMMSGEENLDYYAQIYRVPDSKTKISTLLDAVGLKDRGKDRVGKYSKGMRQRLGLARSMIHDPDILILDEPTSGVDPTGQIEIRKLLLDIAARGKTIFLSSHNLDEVERICSRIALIHKGEIKLFGSMENLRREMGESGIVIETDMEVADSIIAELQSMQDIGFQEKNGKRLVFTPPGKTGASDIISLLVGKGVKIESVIKKEASLEDMYSSILKEAESHE